VNNGDQALHFLYLLGVLVLVASAFGVRRIPMGQGLKMAAAWLLIFAAAFAVFALKDEFAALGRRIVSGEPEMVRAGETLRIRKSEDGHFWVQAKVNGKESRLMVDSGATVTTLSPETARRAGIAPSDAFKALVSTANGVVMVQRGRAERFAVGDIVREDFPVHLSDSDDTDLIGMNFLSTLSGWSVEGDWLVLRP
jgi:aspartyl protease family protein